MIWLVEFKTEVEPEWRPVPGPDGGGYEGGNRARARRIAKRMHRETPYFCGRRMFYRVKPYARCSA